MVFSALSGVVALVGLCVHAGISCRFFLTERSFGRTPLRATIAWNALLGATLAFLAVWGLVGLIDGGVLAVPATLGATAAIVALARPCLSREARFERLATLTPEVRRRVEWGLLALASLLMMLAMEVPWSHALPFFGPTYWWL